MADKPIPTPEELRQLLSYDPETGKLFWKERGPEWFTGTPRSPEWLAKWWNSRFAGAEAFTTANSNGHKTGAVFGVKYLAHRIIWAMVTGEWPEDQIDHIDGDRAHNRFENLREATNAENCQNREAVSRSSSGHIGVHYNSTLHKWRAGIGKDWKYYWLGNFDHKEDAIAAYLEAKQRIHTFSPEPRRPQ